MNIITKIGEIKHTCFDFKRLSGGYAFIDKGKINYTDDSFQIIKTFKISNLNHICVCDKSLIAASDTSGRLFLINIRNNSVKCIAVENHSEGTAPILYENSIFWSEWDGRIIRYDIVKDTTEIIFDISNDEFFFSELNINRENNTLLFCVLSTNDQKRTVYSLNITTKHIAEHRIPLSSSWSVLISGDNNGGYYLYDYESSLIYKFKISEENLFLDEFICLKKHFSPYIEMLSNKDMICLKNSNRITMFDVSTKDIILDFEEKYISSVDILSNHLCVGTWEKGMIFNIEQT